LSKRALLFTLRDIAAQVIKEKSENRRLFRNSELYVTVTLALQSQGQIMRSVKMLPERYDTTYANIIRVFSLDRSVEFIPTTAHELQYKRTRKYKDPYKKYFYLEDDRLCVDDPDIDQVIVSGIFKEPMKARQLDVNAAPLTCMFPMEDEFVCPKDYMALVMDLAVQKLSGTVQLLATQDEQPDANATRR
jgi:hypothetical protein